MQENIKTKNIFPHIHKIKHKLTHHKMIFGFDSEDETKSISQINSKVLILNKIHENEQLNRNKQLKHGKSYYVISSFLNQNEKKKNIIYKQPKKNLNQNKSIDAIYNELLDTSSITHNVKRNTSQVYQEKSIYMKKHILIENTCENKTVVILDDPIKKNKMTELYQKKKTKTNNKLTTNSKVHYYAIIIQKHWRGFYFRRFLYEKMTQYTFMHFLISALNKSLVLKKQREVLNMFKELFTFLTNKNNIKIKMPIIYSKNKMALNNAFLKKEIIESIEFKPDKNQQFKKHVCCQENTIMLEGRIETKKKERLLRQFFKKKLKKDKQILQSYFYQMFLHGIIEFVKKQKKNKNEMNQNITIIQIILKKENIEKKFLQKSFLKYFLIKILLQQAKNNFNHQIVENKKRLSSDPVTQFETNNNDRIINRNKKLHRLVLINERIFLTYFKKKFMKLYYRGVLKFVCLASQPLIDAELILSKNQIIPKEISKEEESTLIIKQEGNIEEKLKITIDPIKEIEKQLADDEMMRSLQRKEKKSMSLKENKLNLRNKIHMKKFQNIYNVFNKLYRKQLLTSLMYVLKQTGSILNQTKIIFCNEIEMNDNIKASDSIKRVKAGVQKLQKEKKERLNKLIPIIRKSNLVLLKKALLLFLTKAKLLSFYKYREDQLQILINKKDTCLFHIIKNYFLKMNLKSKLVRLMSINKNQKRKSKTKKLSESTSVGCYESIDLRDSFENIHGDNESNNTEIQRNPKRPKKKKSLFSTKQSFNDSQIQTDNQPTTIMKHIKLHSIITKITKKSIGSTFYKWREPEKERNLELEQYMASCVLINIFTKNEKRYQQILISYFTKWETAAGISLMTKSIKTRPLHDAKSFEIVGKKIQALFLNKKKKYFIRKLNQMYYWHFTHNQIYTQGELIFKMKNGKEKKLIRNKRLLRNWLWKFKIPLQYYFFKYNSKVFFMKVKELEDFQMSFF